MKSYKDIKEELINNIKTSDSLVLFQFLGIVRNEIDESKKIEKAIIEELEKRFPSISKEL